MVFNNDILYLHIGKTGGMSTSRFLCKILKDPVYHVVPSDELHIHFGSATNIEGIRHETLTEALEITETYGLQLADFKVVYATIRHPYDLELSLFNYLTQLHKKGRRVHSKIIKHLNEGFESYVCNIQYHRNKVKIEDYFLIDGRLPDNLQLVRFENLKDELEEIDRLFGNGKRMSIPHLNKSKKQVQISDLIPSIKEEIYRKYQWLFDNGYYDR